VHELSFLSLTDDEIALLRFTCDLYFVEESPLFHLEAAQAEPGDYESSYQSLIAKNVVDPHGFRITDDALNRIAPVTEADGRVVHIVQRERAAPEQTDFYLLDDIAVQFLTGDGVVALGQDLDPDELTEHLARRLVPRKSTGDSVDLRLTALEYVALSVLTRALIDGENESLSLDDARALLGQSPPEEALSQSGPQLLAMMSVRPPEGRPAGASEEETFVGDAAWDGALRALLKKNALRKAGDGFALRPALRELVVGLREGERHTFVRYDFGEEEWALRETTFVQLEGSLFFLGASRDGSMRIQELDGAHLKQALLRAVGPLARDQSAPDPRRFRDLLVDAPSAEGSPVP
jgi:hypothetical protein